MRGYKVFMEDSRQKELASLCSNEGKIIDLGCSQRPNLYLDSARTLGLDIRLNPECPYGTIIRDFEKGLLPLDIDNVKSIIIGEVLEHFRGYERLLIDCFKLLEDGGRLVVSFPDPLIDSFMVFRGKSLDHIHILHPIHLKRLLEDIGFKSVVYSRCFKWYVMTGLKLEG